MVSRNLQTLVCAAPYGVGGMGQHLAQLVEAARGMNLLERYYTSAIREADAAGQVVREPWFPRLAHATPVRFSPGWQGYLSADLFDRAASAQLGKLDGECRKIRGAEFIGFGGQAEHCLLAAKRLGFDRLELASATSHIEHVARQHARSRRAHGLEATWINSAQIRKCHAEYALADTIQVSSEYARQSFLEAGVSASKLRRVSLKTPPRFQPPATRPDDGVFRIAYVGSLTITKGIPLLLEAFSRLSAPRAELILVGGWTTRGMRAYMQGWMARNPHIRVTPGDPLPTLQRADAYVHPSYDDGWGYAPMEALACGVPVIVTEHTGMKERVREGVNGYVVPTGDWSATLERLEHLYRHGMRRD